jgi:hypothetical protein
MVLEISIPHFCDAVTIYTVAYLPLNFLGSGYAAVASSCEHGDETLSPLKYAEILK